MNVTPSVSSTRIGRTLILLRAHKRRIVFGLIFAYAAFLFVHPDEEGRVADLIWFALLVTFIASQFFWIGRILDLGQQFIPGKPRRGWLAIIAGLIYLFIFIHSYPSIESTNAHVFRAADYHLHSTLIEGVFWWWFVGSLFAFALVIAFGMVDHVICAATWVYCKAREGMRGNRADPKPG